MKITLSARSKILSIGQTDKAFRILAIGSMIAGSHIDLIPISDLNNDDVIICSIPLVVTDIKSVALLADRTVDFSYDDDEFIISNRGNER